MVREIVSQNCFKVSGRPGRFGASPGVQITLRNEEGLDWVLKMERSFPRQRRHADVQGWEIYKSEQQRCVNAAALCRSKVELQRWPLPGSVGV